MSDITKNIDDVMSKIKAACDRCGRDYSEVTLIAVSKTKPFSDLLEAASYGMTEFGENRPQEIRDKYKLLQDTDFKNKAHFHMIGQLQSNKIKYVYDTTVLIHSIDSFETAKAVSDFVSKKNTAVDILLEVNVGEEESKSGFSYENVKELLPDILALPGLNIRGLMTVAPYVDDPEENRPIFRKLKQLMVDINSENVDNICMNILSMGMTNDYEVAIEEGATHVRVGTGIFGKRDVMIKA